MRTDLPTGEVTLVFTDIEGSTRLLHELGPDAYAAELAEHRRIVREAFGPRGGIEVDTQGDAFFIAFPSAPQAVAAAREATDALARGRVRIRIGIHTGAPHVTDEGYVGPDVHLGARIGAVGHGGQVLMSGATRQQIEAETTDLGEHRLKDLDELVWIYQLGSERFPPLKTISNSNLPIPASTFVGRSSEVDEIAALIRGEARLITLSGPGGTGKTRLAIEAASTVIPEFRNGVFWAGLAPLRDPGLVLEEVSQTLGVKDGLAEFISEREMLLVLDNLEQVIDAAPDLVALLERCPNLKMLVTSRELLRVRGEVEYPVLPLAEPDGVELFSARSGLVADGSIVKLCRSLDHLPLALELAAARTGVLTAEQILERLDKRLDLLKGGRDADQRQATLRALIDWSYELLSDEEKRLFERLSVFRGGCSLEAAEEVADADLDTLQALVDKSLVRHTADRFWMLETIREYAVEHLRASADEIRVRDRYVDYFMNLASEAFPHLRDIALRGPGPLLDRLEDDLDNFRSVLDHLESTGRREAALRLAGDIAEFWYQRGYLREGHQRLEALLKDAEPSPVRAKALIGASDFAAAVGDAELGLEHAREAVELFRSIGDDRALADAFWRVASLTGTVGGWAEAVRLLEQTIAMFTELDDQHALLAVTRNLAWARENLGDLEGCRILHEENLVRTRVLGNRLMEAITMGALAMNAVKAGRLEDAPSLLRGNIPIFDELGDAYYIAENLSRVACALAPLGHPEEATRLIGYAESLMEELGTRHQWANHMNAETLVQIRSQAAPDDVESWLRSGAALKQEAAVALAVRALG